MEAPRAYHPDTHAQIFSTRTDTGTMNERTGEMNERTGEPIIAAELPREEVFTGILHDLKNPLATLLLNHEVLLEDLRRSRAAQERTERKLQASLRAINRMRETISETLDLSWLRSSYRLRTAPVRVEWLLQRIQQDNSFWAEEMQVNLVTEDLYGGAVLVDEKRVRQVLNNLIGNAVRFAPPGSPITIRSARETILKGRWCRIEVQDCGPGIPPEQLPFIFRKYWRSDPADPNSSGIGLAISKEIVEAHGGRIWARTQTNGCNGAVLSFTLPGAVTDGHADGADGDLRGDGAARAAGQPDGKEE